MSKLKQYLPYLAGIGVALAWGFSFMFTRGALDYLSPFHLLGMRFATAVLAMALLRVCGLISIKVAPVDYLNLLPLAFFQPVLYFASETTGILLTSSSYAGMMIAIIPIFVTIFAAIFLHEYPNRIQFLFIIASVGGAIFIIYMDTQSIAGVNPLGTAYLLAAVIAGASFNIFSRKASVKHPPVRTTWIMMVFGALAFNTIALVEHFRAGNLNDYLAPLANQWLPIVYLGVFSSVVAFFLYNFVLSKITATQGSVFANMVTVVAIVAGVVFREEIVFWYHLAGTAAILIGVWGTNRFAPAVLERKQQKKLAAQTTTGTGD